LNVRRSASTKRVVPSSGLNVKRRSFRRGRRYAALTYWKYASLLMPIHAENTLLNASNENSKMLRFRSGHFLLIFFS
jgi:hypothetical protein